MLILVNCDFCGKEFKRHYCQLKGKKHHFCCRECLANYSSKTKNPKTYLRLKDYSKIGKHLGELNRQLNPIRMTEATREKLRRAHLGTGEGYAKLYGQLEHRVVAEQILGRKLRYGEVVHHIDGNKRNNDPSNLIVFASQAEHAKYHADFNWFISEIQKMDDAEGGDAQ